MIRGSHLVHLGINCSVSCNFLQNRGTISVAFRHRCGSSVSFAPAIRAASPQPVSHQVDVITISMMRRHSTGGTSGGKDIDVVDKEKPIHIRVAEQRDSQIFTFQEYVEREEEAERRKLSERLSEVRDSPAWMLWGLLFLSLGVITVVISIRVRREQMRFDPKLRAVKAFDSPEGPSIGGPFSLIGVDGRRYTEKDFLGKWLYIYFGFTNCPDVCPEEMAKLSRVVQHLDKKVGRDYWQPIFISLDPHRDTPEKIRDYLADFNPRILGLVGTQEEVESVARQYRVYFALPDETVLSEDDYLVDHSIIMYLMNPEGKFCDYTTKEFQWFESYSKLLRRMMDYERDKVIQRREAGASDDNGQAAINIKVANVATMLDENVASVQKPSEI
ncbi:electon transport protein SCO1/SCO2, putative [Trypanosoma brucei gambiense DAL972]|uniref:Electon transport protein SCO1/SCO2, putative n=1 Tax=Trypanosoma brucei gambiense (strain MHOM/CI/86/DAL972) TaxID=679716 RepID=C9ZX87_TRYB9|nr:electon transport protein SCO1/SCO2, putative [Trypanosoma brucei gambiense DAL972]CBH14031.1 electon transport protein SCO1/SCO2, putative [Trypanosoma brucei gambiense DAL972]|eukprot:XP_011776302.1 electon transport protein SCO1/SCO2, putative [Trypanosoma brucei gambiense DAL972]